MYSDLQSQVNNAISLGASSLGVAEAEFGHVSFTRRDGPATVQISAALTPDAAKKLDALLRDLIAEDAPLFQALQERQFACQQAALAPRVAWQG